MSGRVVGSDVSGWTLKKLAFGVGVSTDVNSVRWKCQQLYVAGVFPEHTGAEHTGA